MGKGLRRKREDRDLSQMKVAADADLHINALGNIERGDSLPSVYTLIQICRSLGVTPSEFFQHLEKLYPTLFR